jgi:hypothetical protein
MLALALGTAACRPAQPVTLEVAERIALPSPNVRSIDFVGPDGAWLGAPGELIRIDGAGREVARLAIGEGSTPMPVGEQGGWRWYQAGATVVALDPGGEGVAVERQGMGGVMVADVRGRLLFRASGAGALIAHDPQTLEPFWGWAAVGRGTTALAISPEGDRVYHAVDGEAEEGGPALLVRDFQTGRTLRRIPLLEPIATMLARRDGSLLTLSNGGGPGMVLRMAWRAGSLDVDWRRTAADLGVADPVAIALSRDGNRLAVLSTENGTGLLVLDAETGATIDFFRDESAGALAAGFDGEDRTYLLLPGELLRLE